MYIYVCIYTYIYIDIHEYTYIYIHILFIEAAERITADPFSEISAGFLGEFWQTLGELGQDFGRIWEDLAGFRQDVGWIWEPRA